MSCQVTDTAAVTWQDVNGNNYGPLTSSFTTLVKSSLANARLTLAPISAGPNPTGANPGTGTASTDANGNAVFTYTGANAGNDVAQATVTAPGVTLNSNTANISWGNVLQPIVTGQVKGNFYMNTSQ